MKLHIKKIISVGIAFVALSVSQNSSAFNREETKKFFEQECSGKNSHKLVHCSPSSIEYVLIEGYTYKEIPKKLKTHVPVCKKIDEKKVYPYHLSNEERDRLLVQRAETEITSLSDKSMETLMRGPILKKTEKGWTIKKFFGEYFSENRYMLRGLQNTLDEIKNPERYKLPEFFVESDLMKFRPKLGIKVPEGWILGLNGGEWGGYLVFKNEMDQFEKIVIDNIRRIYQTSFGLFAISGDDNGPEVYNHGLIYKIEKVNEDYTSTIAANIFFDSYAIEQVDEDTILLGNQFGSFRFTADGLCRLGVKSEEGKK